MQINRDLFIDLAYPVGSIYMSVNSTNPGTLFGGTWEQLKDRFLLGAGNTYANGKTGGEATHYLTISEMPNHNHRFVNVADNFLTAWNTHQGNRSGFELSSLFSANLNAPAAGGEGVQNSLDTKYTGGNTAHNNMPPYLVVYMWKRIG